MRLSLAYQGQNESAADFTGSDLID